MSRTHRNNITTFPARTRPFWKLLPEDRISHGLCQHCGQHDPNLAHFDFGCSANGGRR